MCVDNSTRQQDVHGGGIPLVESGTAGYLGQVQLLLKMRLSLRPLGSLDSVSIVYQSRLKTCFLCAPSDRSHRNLYAVSYGPNIIFFRASMCTQAYVYSSGRRQLFGGDENGGTESDEAVKEGENG